MQTYEITALVKATIEAFTEEDAREVFHDAIGEIEGWGGSLGKCLIADVILKSDEAV